jgi:ATP-dependent Clp protease ATP-binding subunit ClpB
VVATRAQHLDPTQRSHESRDFEAGLRRKIVGQTEAVQAVVDMYQVFRAGLNSPGRPVGNLLFLGPTGAGKTRVVEATAENLFGDPRAVIKVDCAEFQHSHEINRFASGIPRASRNSSVDHAGSTGAISHGQIENKLSAV